MFSKRLKSAARFAGMAILAMCLVSSTSRADDPPFEPRTVPYKVVDELKIEADVYRADDEELRPVVVWIHGGALILGSRRSPPRNLREFCAREGLALVSIDYRLAPEVKLPAIVEDVQDAFRWVHGDGAKEFHLDTRKVVVAGGSAGAYLTLMTGYCVEPRPAALVSFWGFGDIDGEWQTTPSEHYLKSELVPEEAAREVVNGPALSGSDEALGKHRRKFFVWCRQNAAWPREVSGFDPLLEKEKFSPYSPIRNLSETYPPVLLIHGTADTDVPYQRSVEMAAALAERKLTHELLLVPNGSHGLGSGDKQVIDYAHSRALEFMKRHLK